MSSHKFLEQTKALRKQLQQEEMNSPPTQEHSDEEETPECNCGYPSFKRQIKKQGPTFGKWFWGCGAPYPPPKGQSNCKFFQLVGAKAKKSASSCWPKKRKIEEQESQDPVDDTPEPPRSKPKTVDRDREFALKLLEERLVHGEKNMKELKIDIQRLTTAVDRFIAAISAQEEDVKVESEPEPEAKDD